MLNILYVVILKPVIQNSPARSVSSVFMYGRMDAALVTSGLSLLRGLKPVDLNSKAGFLTRKVRFISGARSEHCHGWWTQCSEMHSFFHLHPKRYKQRHGSWCQWVAGGQHKYEGLLQSQLRLWKLGASPRQAELPTSGTAPPAEKWCCVASAVFLNAPKLTLLTSLFPFSGYSSDQPCSNYRWCF